MVKLAAEICGVPVALISLVETERQWFKAKEGLDVSETPITQSICAHAILENDVTVIEDTTLDPRSNCNTLVTGDPNFRFYAGAVLKTEDKLPIGMLCVLDYKPNNLTEFQSRALKTLARQVMLQLELRKTLKEQRQSEEQFRQMANTIPQLAWITDETGSIHWYNQRWYDYTGTDFNTMQGWGWQAVHHADYVNDITERFKRAVELGLAWEDTFPLRSRSGEYRWFLSRAFPMADSNGKVTGWFGTNTDIEDKRRSELALREKDERLNIALQAGQMGTWELDVVNAFLSCSPTCKSNYGLKPEDELSYQMLTTLVHEDDRHHWANVVTNAIESATDFEMEYRTVWPDQSTHWIYVRGSCTASAHGKATTLSGVSIDITARKILEAAAHEAHERAEAANLAKTDFLATMSHEIRTPMNAVIGLSNILAKSQPLAPKQQEYIKTLQMSADSLLGLINDLLDIAKIEARSVELEHIPFSITQMVQESISMMNVRAKEKGLAFTVVQACPCIEKRQVVGDPTRLRQILLNLCSNAIKFTDTGSITLRISCDDTQIEGKELIRIAVKDTGIGIAANKIGDIFHKFTQADSSINRKYGGTGLGLAITKTLAEIMGGTIELTSEVGVGSTFTVVIPLDVTNGEALPQYIPRPASVEPIHSVNHKGHILLVEDYEPNVLVATTFLEGFGYGVDVANDGLQAVEKMKHGVYVAALMDVQMHGMNGLQATQLIRDYETKHKRPKAYIIGMTAHALLGDRERCLAAGMDDYISKPFNPDMLEKMLGQLTRTDHVAA